MDTANFFESSLWSFWAEIEPHFTLRQKKEQRRPYAHLYFDQLFLDFSALTGYLPDPGTLNYFLMALVRSEIDTRKFLNAHSRASGPKYSHNSL